MSTISISPYIDIQRAARILTSEKQPVEEQDVIELILAGHLQCYVRDSDFGNFIDFDTFETGTWVGSTEPQLVTEPLRHIDPKVTHIWVTFPELARYANGKPFTRPSEHCAIEPKAILLSTAEVKSLKKGKPIQQAVIAPTGNQPVPPDVTGRRGVLQQLLFDTLTDYFGSGKVLEHGSAFRSFLKFLDDRYNSKPRPAYMSDLKKVDRKDPKACLLWMEKGKPKSQSYEYITKEFSKIRKEFSTNI